MMNLKKGFDWAIKWSLVKGINIFHCFISLIYLVFEYLFVFKRFSTYQVIHYTRFQNIRT